MKTSLSRLAHESGKALNANFFFLILYYCVVLTLLMILFDWITGHTSLWDSSQVVSYIGIGVVLAFVDRFMLQPKHLSWGKRLGIGALLVILGGTILGLILKWLF